MDTCKTKIMGIKIKILLNNKGNNSLWLFKIKMNSIKKSINF